MPFAVSARPVQRRLAALGILAAAVVTALGVLPTTAYATKGGSAAATAQAQQKLEALTIQADRAVEAYDQAQLALAQLTARAGATKAATAKQQALVDAAKGGVQAYAVARYEGGNTPPALAALLAKNPQNFMQQAQMLAQVDRHQSASLSTLIVADRSLAQAQRTADQALAAQQKSASQLAAKKAAVEKIVADQQALVGQLQSRAQAEQRAASRAVVRSNLVIGRNAGRAPSAPIVPPPASGRAGAVLAFAYAQLNKPYVFGGSGLSSYDCSGLTMRAYGAAGVALAHSAAAQQHEGAPVPLSAMQPGDLIFWGSPAYHVGIYVGGGQVLDAPHTGAYVNIRGIWGSPSGAVRP